MSDGPMMRPVSKSPPRTNGPWRGVIEEYRGRLPVSDATPVVSLCEGGTPLGQSGPLSAETGCDV